ncbi:cupin domain-containing protein [cf. Phormidesmis sp. LEGE 11477]|uniref:cupin domain-containing protein n=1 Tax=cf. Phormidesmis sp. LEGE 11477 TaxID=1828680 RepID=UPI001882C64C|nr:cupin domain-containing protein [cf. Phormidesmis sp. LEGE 11477]MBE9060956.1 cupin domain-containing protein [cf. Phormidesmis sp. LEGE 11477]
MTTQEPITTNSATNLTVSADNAKAGSMGQKLLISGNAIAMRLWDEQPGDGEQKQAAARNYETVGYVLSGRAELSLEGNTILLEPGISWTVPEGTEHSYKILEHFQAVEATHPSARGDG